MTGRDILVHLAPGAVRGAATGAVVGAEAAPGGEVERTALRGALYGGGAGLLSRFVHAGHTPAADNVVGALAGAHAGRRAHEAKHAGLPMGAGNILANIGSAVTRGATQAVGAVAKAAPQTAARFAPQIARGIGMMAKNPRAVGGAALGAGALTIGGGLAATRQ